MNDSTAFRRGDVVMVNLDPVVGREIGFSSPAVVIQNDVGNRFSPTLIVAAITGFSKAKAKFPFCVVLRAGEGGLSKDSVVNAAQIRTIDKRRIAPPRLGCLDRPTMAAVDEALRVSLAV